MGWFEEQIRDRRRADKAVFEDSFRQIAGAVMGKRMSRALYDDRQVTTDAVGEILRYYHIRPKEVPAGMKDMNEVLEFLMRPYGIMRREVELKKGWRKAGHGALLGTRKDDGTVVALLPRAAGGYSFFDRVTGKTVKITGRTEGLIDTHAFAFYRPFPMRKMGVGEFYTFIKEQLNGFDYARLLLSVLVIGGLSLLIPYFAGNLISATAEGAGTHIAMITTPLFLCISVMIVLCGLYRNFLVAGIRTRVSGAVDAAALMRLLSLPAGFFRNYSVGGLVGRVSGAGALAENIVTFTVAGGIGAFLSVIYIIAMFVIAPSAALPVVGIVLLELVAGLMSILVGNRLSKSRMLLDVEEKGISHAIIGGVSKIRVSGAERRAFARWGNAYAETAGLTYNPPFITRLPVVLSPVISLVGLVLVLAGAEREGFGVTGLFSFLAVYGLLCGAVHSITGLSPVIARIRPALELLKPILEAEPEVNENKSMVTRLQGGIELSNVTFRYSEDMPLIFDNLSLKIRSGEYVAIVGRTGCGKSTLLRLMLGFERPQKGAIYYDGRDLKTLDPKSLRRRIGTVLQDGKLFAGDIASNITISAPWLTKEELWEAARIAGIADDIRALPMGMNTIITEGSGTISGGQRQRLLIARAVAPRPGILMFDEATSALDNITQKSVSDALDKMKCTRIVIAHRLSTIRQCDRIIVLDGGKIAEEGTYDELIARKGVFAGLVERQRLGAG